MKLVLFDIQNTLVRDPIDVSQYITETIRNVYGLYTEVSLHEYLGRSIQEILEDVLTKNGIGKEDIDSKLDLLPNDLYYSYYNVAGHEEQETASGAQQLLAELSKGGALLGIASSEPERIAKFRLERSNLSSYFKVAAYGNEARSMKERAKLAIERARQQHNVDKVFFVANSLPQVEAAAELGVVSIAVSNGGNAALLRNAGAKEVVDSLHEKGKIANLILKD